MCPGSVSLRAHIPLQHSALVTGLKAVQICRQRQHYADLEGHVLLVQPHNGRMFAWEKGEPRGPASETPGYDNAAANSGVVQSGENHVLSCCQVCLQRTIGYLACVKCNMTA